MTDITAKIGATETLKVRITYPAPNLQQLHDEIAVVKDFYGPDDLAKETVFLTAFNKAPLEAQLDFARKYSHLVGSEAEKDIPCDHIRRAMIEFGKNVALACEKVEGLSGNAYHERHLVMQAALFALNYHNYHPAVIGARIYVGIMARMGDGKALYDDGKEEPLFSSDGKPERDVAIMALKPTPPLTPSGRISLTAALHPQG